MAMRSAPSRVRFSLIAARSMESSRGVTRYFSEGKGRILSEEELAAETIYIQKMERERLEKLKQKAEKEKAEKAKENTDKDFNVTGRFNKYTHIIEELRACLHRIFGF